MKVKNVLFVTIFLAAAGLGLAHQPKNSTEAHPPQSDGTTKPDGVSQVQANLADISGKISSKCSTAIVSIATSPEFSKCVPLKALVPILPIITNPSTLQNVLKDPKNYPTLIEKPLGQFATELCAAPKCSDDGVNAAIKALQDGCKDDFKTNELVRLLRSVIVFYSPLRDITCFKDKDQFCFDQTALTLTKLPPSPITLTGNKFLDSVAVADPTAICTKCNKNMVNTYFNFLKDKKDKKDSLPFDILRKYGIDGKEIDRARISAIVKCGLHFVDGSTS